MPEKCASSIPWADSSKNWWAEFRRERRKNPAPSEFLPAAKSMVSQLEGIDWKSCKYLANLCCRRLRQLFSVLCWLQQVIPLRHACHSVHRESPGSNMIYAALGQTTRVDMNMLAVLRKMDALNDVANWPSEKRPCNWKVKERSWNSLWKLFPVRIRYLGSDFRWHEITS